MGALAPWVCCAQCAVVAGNVALCAGAVDHCMHMG